MQALSKISSIGKKSLVKLGFIQALGIFIYCFFVGLVFWGGDHWIGNMNNYLGPVLVLSLLSVSVLVCSLLALGYPFILFWEEKKTKDALKLVGITASWLLSFVILGFCILLII
ncbi:hypothetical protein ACFL0F_00885 [Patescibacteria group bacterium]